MIDLHTHSLLSDGELLPLELARRAKVKGYTTLGISDHVDVTNIEYVAASILKVSEKSEYHEGIQIVPGVEITHSPAQFVGEMIVRARKLGISYVVVHGETIAEPVEEGTNRAAIEAGVDILAHPGLITEEDVIRARAAGGPPGNQRAEGTLPHKRPRGKTREKGGGKTHLRHRFSQPVRPHRRSSGAQDYSWSRAFP